MAITALTELEVKVIRDMPRRPDSNLVNDALRLVWREFLIESEVWREDLAAFDAVQDQATYTLSPSAGVINRIIKVNIDDSTVDMDPKGYYLDGVATLTFEEDYVPSESGTANIAVQVALEPDVNGTAGPAWVMNRWSEGLVSGAQARLYAMKGRQWYDPGLFQLRRSDFNTAMGDAVVARAQKRTTRKTGFFS
jgi:hypothetical protein